MKTFNTILFFISISVSIAQVPKNVIVEHFTNSVCSVCASKNPSLYDNLDNHPLVMHIAYYPSSPYASCLLNQHNVSENDGRTNFYGIYGATPRIVLEGEVASPNVTFGDPTLFDPYSGQWSPISISLNQIKYNQDSIKVEVIVKVEASHNLGTEKIFIAVAEDTIFYSSPNGETQHYDVFRKALTPSDGLNIQIPSIIGDSVVVSFVANVHQDWDFSRIFSFAILQNSNKQVLQANYLLADGSQTIMNVDQKSELSEWKLYPNPANLFVNLELAEDVDFELEIYNLLGEKIAAFRGRHSGQFDISQIVKGVYFLSVKAGKEKYSKKLVVH